MRQYKDAEGLVFMIFILVIVDFIPSWVLGPWFYVFNAFCIIAIAVGMYDTLKD